MIQSLVKSVANLVLVACKGNTAAASQTMAEVGKQLINNNSGIIMDVMKLKK